MFEKKLAFRPRAAADDRELLGFNDMKFVISQYNMNVARDEGQKSWESLI